MTATETKVAHTPTPWHVNGLDCIASVRGNLTIAAKVYRPEVDAEFIVRAVNAHDDLLAACKYVEQFCDDPMNREQMNTIGKRLRAAIAKAEGNC